MDVETPVDQRFGLGPIDQISFAVRSVDDEHGEGLHHLRYPVTDIAASRAEMEAAGFEVAVEGGSGDVAFAYLESPLLNGMTVELIQLP